MIQKRAATEYAPKTAIRCAGVTKTYGQGNAAVQTLRGVDLEIRTGELLMLEGPSGCGKTTLISVLAGLMHRDGGDCSVLEHDYKTMSATATTYFRRKNIGFVFQAFNLIPALTAAENASTPLIIAGEKRHAAVARASAMFQEMGFDDRMMGALPKDLSGGRQQRVAIARAMVHNPRLIVCDEPTSALDRESGYVAMELMRRFALGQDRSLVVVTHDDRIFEFADRIASMADRRIPTIDNETGIGREARNKTEDQAQARAELQSTETDLERLIVPAPVGGQVLQLKVHLGEFAPEAATADPTRKCHVVACAGGRGRKRCMASCGWRVCDWLPQRPKGNSNAAKVFAI